ncbi:TIGR02221 family CRISPR-associated protein [Desulfothermobacter acidiphilus]|uniref:TIGR02221 family CRISPR-associated protein n=1 Tax=Desulfothermobacter acidiphilus TaxID=1938353 RepID=UPI003F88A761
MGNGSQLVAFSSIGKGDYKEAEYFAQESGSCRTRFFSVAVAYLFKPERLFLAVTSEVKNDENYLRMKQELEDRGLSGIVKEIVIPPGRSEEELWKIFDLVSEAIPERARVIFDITHGFRSLPFVFLGVVNYLGLTKAVRLERIVYGAFEAKEEREGDIPRAPIFDLTMLVELQDWLQAVNAFMLRGEGQRLAELLDEAHRRPWRSRAQEDLPDKLQKMAGNIKQFSDSVRLLRPLEALGAAARVQKLLPEVKKEAERWAKPFGYILSRIDQELSPLATEQADTLTQENLERQLALIDYYLQKDLVVQAVLLARECMVNWLAWRVREPNWRKQEVRAGVLEAVLNAAASNQTAMGAKRPGSEELEKEKEGLSKKKEEILQRFNSWPEAKKAADLWHRLRELRNDVAHCAFRDSVASPEAVKKNAKELKQELNALLEQESSGGNDA